MNGDWAAIIGKNLFPYGFPPLAVGLLIAIFGITVLFRERNTRLSLAFFALTLSVSVWFIAQAFAYSTKDENLALLWNKIGQCGVTFIPSTVLIFTASMVRLIPKFKIGIWISAVLSFLFCLSVLLTPWFVRGVYPYFWGFYTQSGFLMALFLIYFCAVLVISLSLYRQELRKETAKIHQARIRSFLIVFSIGYFASVDFLPTFGIPVYPFGYIPAFIALFLAARAILVYRLMDITPSLAADQILSTMVTPLIVCDSDQIIRLVNDVTCEIFGYREQELVGQPVDIFVKGSDEEKHRLRDALKSLLVKNQELVFFSKNNGPVDICVSISHLLGRNQTKLASIIVASDMRERKKSEQDLLEKKIELARSNAEREQLELFAYVASHDLKEPLQKIIGFGELLGKNFKEKLPAEGRDYLERMINATLRMNQLIEDLIKFSKVAMNAEQAPLTRINLKELLQDVLSDLEMKVVQSKGEVIIGELPSLNANRLEMHQLFQNLISNALKFHPKDAPPKITITGNLLDKDSVEIRVEDNGIGFDEQYAAKIFKPFERLHGRAEYDGSGLGLAICHRIAKNHRGRIIARSTPGKGSVFTITLPLNLI